MASTQRGEGISQMQIKWTRRRVQQHVDICTVNMLFCYSATASKNAILMCPISNIMSCLMTYRLSNMSNTAVSLHWKGHRCITALALMMAAKDKLTVAAGLTCMEFDRQHWLKLWRCGHPKSRQKKGRCKNCRHLLADVTERWPIMMMTKDNLQKTLTWQ